MKKIAYFCQKLLKQKRSFFLGYSHLSNKRHEWNKRHLVFRRAKSGLDEQIKFWYHEFQEKLRFWMASQDQSWFKPLFHLEKRGLKKIHRIKHTCCLFDRREYLMNSDMHVLSTVVLDVEPIHLAIIPCFGCNTININFWCYP